MNSQELRFISILASSEAGAVSVFAFQSVFAAKARRTKTFTNTRFADMILTLIEGGHRGVYDLELRLQPWPWSTHGAMRLRR